MTIFLNAYRARYYTSEVASRGEVARIPDHQPVYGGSLNPRQPALLRGAMDRLPGGAVVVLAFDNDEGGCKLAVLVPAGRDVRRVLPDSGKDWNDVLKRQLGL